MTNTQTYYQFDREGVYLGPITVPETDPMPRMSTLEQPLGNPGSAWFRGGQWVYSLPGEASDD